MSNPQTQTFKRVIVRSAAVLTGSYVAGTTITDLEEYNQLNLFIDFTIGSLTDVDIKVEFSDDGENFYQETFGDITSDEETDTAGHHTFAATGKYMLAIPIKCSAVKISALGNGTVTDSSLAITAVVGVQ